MHMVLLQMLTTHNVYANRKETFIVKKDLFEEAELDIELFDAADIITASNVLDDEDPLSGGI